MDAGIPSAGTVTGLPAGLGRFCFPLQIPPFGSASPVAVFNNLGKTDRIGVSTYFGSPVADPARAPSYFLLRPAGDITNLPAGTQWTFQGIVINPAASSPKGASVTNALVLEVTDAP
jgi:hypothetical protein